MQSLLIQFAEAESAGEGDLLGTLGIDWTALLLQTISFIILVIILAKWIYPPIAAMLDRHDERAEAAMKAAEAAEKRASESEAKTAALLEKSQIDAAEIITSAKTEAAEIIARAESDATTRAETIVSNARADIERDVEQARLALRSEMVDLVSLATEKVVNSKIDELDENIIASTLKGAN